MLPLKTTIGASIAHLMNFGDFGHVTTSFHADSYLATDIKTAPLDIKYIIYCFTDALIATGKDKN